VALQTVTLDMLVEWHLAWPQSGRILEDQDRLLLSSARKELLGDRTDGSRCTQRMTCAHRSWRLQDCQQ